MASGNARAWEYILKEHCMGIDPAAYAFNVAFLRIIVFAPRIVVSALTPDAINP